MQNSLKLETELVNIINNYTNGNRKTAAKYLRKLSKAKLAHFLIYQDYINGLAEAPFPTEAAFKGFVMLALDNEI